jgi:AbrB family looped-hinge helix DNA binding protein
MVTTVVTQKGQIVIPSKVRTRHGIKKGTRLCITEKGDEIILQPLTREYFHKMAGVLHMKKSLVGELLSERARDKAGEEAKCKK